MCSYGGRPLFSVLWQVILFPSYQLNVQFKKLYCLSFFFVGALSAIPAFLINAFIDRFTSF